MARVKHHFLWENVWVLKLHIVKLENSYYIYQLIIHKDIRENVQLNREDFTEYGYDTRSKVISQSSKNYLQKFSVTHNS